MTIIFGTNFNQSLDNVNLPNELRHIIFGKKFAQSLSNVKFPNTLISIVFEQIFDKTVENVNFPNLLTHLYLKKISMSTFKNLKLPCSLLFIMFDEKFEQNISFGYDFNQSVANVIFPNTLEIITFGYRFSYPVNNLPYCLNKLYLSTLTCELFNLPTSLNNIYIYHIKENNNIRPTETSDKKYILNKIKVPFGCNVHDRFFIINNVN